MSVYAPIAVYATRYALGRRTGAPEDVLAFIQTQGCFGGGTEWLYADKNIHAPIALFEDVDAAKAAGWKAVEEPAPWEFEILDLAGAVHFDSGAAE